VALDELTNGEKKGGSLAFSDMMSFCEFFAIREVTLAPYFALCEALSCESDQPEENPGRQQRAPGVGGVLIGLVQSGEKRRLGTLPGCKTELEELG
jgi:hypothetical protein